jgi:hypothetical protein
MVDKGKAILYRRRELLRLPRPECGRDVGADHQSGETHLAPQRDGSYAGISAYVKKV